MDTSRLVGKNVLITGAAQGMGAAVARHFAAQGAQVCLGDLNSDGASRVAREIRDAGGAAAHVALDVTRRDSVRTAVEHTVREFGSINVMLNNAGINKPARFLDVTEEDWHRIMDVNALGVLLGMQEAARQMIAQGPQAGHTYKIINVGSILSRQAFDDVIPYSCSKHAVLALINGGAKAFAAEGITVNGYAPGVVATEMWEQLDRDMVEIGQTEKEGDAIGMVSEGILLGRYAVPDDVVGTASFLASAESDYMTGQLILIDGGMVMQ